MRQAEEAGWVPLRLELMTGAYHYIAILAQQELFPAESWERFEFAVIENSRFRICLRFRISTFEFGLRVDLRLRLASEFSWALSGLLLTKSVVGDE